MTEEGKGPVSRAYIVRISEEANTGDDAGTDMVPAKRRLIDLGEGKTTTFVGIRDVGEVVVEVVEGGVTAGGAVARDVCVGTHGRENSGHDGHNDGLRIDGSWNCKKHCIFFFFSSFLSFSSITSQTTR